MSMLDSIEDLVHLIYLYQDDWNKGVSKIQKLCEKIDFTTISNKEIKILH